MTPRVRSPETVVRTAVSAVVPFLLAMPVGAQNTPARPPGAARMPRTGAVPVAALAGQAVAVLPVTMVVADAALKHDTAYAKYQDRGVALAWADSAVGAALVERGPEVKWVLPPELRRLARRSPGMVHDPDTYGQAVVRSSRYKELPEPLRANLRNLIALTSGRNAFIPAAITLDHEKDGGAIRASLALVLADARGGQVLWRTTAVGTGPTPSAALDAALATVLPLDPPAP